MMVDYKKYLVVEAIYICLYIWWYVVYQYVYLVVFERGSSVAVPWSIFISGFSYPREAYAKRAVFLSTEDPLVVVEAARWAARIK